MSVKRLRTSAAVLALSVPMLLSACAPRQARTATAGAPGLSTLAPTLTVIPADRTREVPVTAEVAATVTHGSLVSVSLTSASGTSVSGAMRPDGSAWVPSASLAFDETYTAQVVAAGADGRTTSATVSFTTMPKPDSRPIGTAMNLTGNQTYGVGMPIVIDFSVDIPSGSREAVERRLFVQSNPPQVGAWRWYSDRQVMYRPRDYWKPGTLLTVRAAVGGLPIGSRIIDKDRWASARIGRDFHIDVTNSNHMLTITSDGKVIKLYPISMGKPGTPSWSGHFVIMERDYYVVFDTLDEPGGYRIPVNYAERITWSGMFIHSAPWSVWAQGSRNVSHGCVNVAPRNAAWIYRNSIVGDPVGISGTPIHARQGNGWTVWDMSWDEYVRGSALPAPQIKIPSLPTPTI